MFDLALNSGLKMGDLLKLTYGHFKGKEIGDKVRLREQKTKKWNYFILNEKIYNSWSHYCSYASFKDDNDSIFPSNKGGNPLLIESVSNMVKGWCKQAGLEGNYAAPSLRKTFGYFSHKNGVGLHILMKRFNHTSEAVTMRYIGLDDPDVDAVLIDINI